MKNTLKTISMFLDSEGYSYITREREGLVIFETRICTRQGEWRCIIWIEKNQH